MRGISLCPGFRLPIVLVVMIAFILLSATGSIARAAFVTTQLTNNSAIDASPHINASGQVVWVSCSDSHCGINLYSGGITTKLTDSNRWYVDCGNPQINDSGQVAWRCTDYSADSEIYLYSDGVTTQLTSNSYADGPPK